MSFSPAEEQIMNMYQNLSQYPPPQQQQIMKEYNHLRYKYDDKKKQYSACCIGCDDITISYKPIDIKYMCPMCSSKKSPNSLSLQNVLHNGQIKMLEQEISLISFE